LQALPINRKSQRLPTFPGWLKLEAEIELYLPRQAAPGVVRKEFVAVDVFVNERINT